MRLAIVVGNPKPQSRTLGVAEAVADAIAGVVDITERTVIDLADVAGQLFEWPNEELTKLNAAVADSDVVVVASPTYKATYTGLLKAFLDRYPSNGLGGVVAVPVMTGAAPEHAMAPDTHLRPLLVELGASVPTRSLFVVVSQIARLDQIVADWRDENVNALRGAAAYRALLDAKG